jgi:hypothetical protein
LLAAAVLACAVAAVGASAGAAKLLLAADAPRTTLREGTLRIRATVFEEGKPPQENELDVHVRLPERALCVFRAGAQAGRRILVSGNRTWLLVPGTSHAVAVSANQRLVGAASIADVARLRFAEEFDGSVRGREDVDGVACDAVDLKAKSRSAAYGSGTLWSRATDGRALRAQLALRSGKLAKELRFAEYGEERGAIVLRRLEIAHLLPAEHGLRTVLEFLGYHAQPVPDTAFDPQTARTYP